MRLMREPLIRFLLIGAAIFGFYSVTGDTPVSESEDRIVVNAGDIERLGSLWERRWQRPPTAAELQELIAEHVREEVLYREALALGLDRGDTIIRRRLAQKLEFLTEDLATARAPAETELVAYFKANRERYRLPPRLSLTQIYFNPDSPGGDAESAAQAALASLQTESPYADKAALGDRLMLDVTYRQQTQQEIEATFGSAFAEAVLRLEPGEWSGPIASGYGLHVVRVDERIESPPPTLSEIGDHVRADWAYEQRRQANDAIYAALLARYDVTIWKDASNMATETAPATGQGAAQ
jgi:hypothetical protein